MTDSKFVTTSNSRL